MRVAPLPAQVASDPGSITLASCVRDYAVARAEQLGVHRNVYLGILLRNYLNGPTDLLRPLEDGTGKLKRVRMTCGIEARHKTRGKREARRWKLSFSTFMERLILSDADAEADTLLIWPINGSAKPTLKIEQ